MLSFFLRVLINIRFYFDFIFPSPKVVRAVSVCMRLLTTSSGYPSTVPTRPAQAPDATEGLTYSARPMALRTIRSMCHPSRSSHLFFSQQKKILSPPNEIHVSAWRAVEYIVSHTMTHKQQKEKILPFNRETFDKCAISRANVYVCDHLGHFGAQLDLHRPHSTRPRHQTRSRPSIRCEIGSLSDSSLVLNPAPHTPHPAP